MTLVIFLGIVPEPLDPVTITNQVSTYLQDQNQGREIDPNDSIMIFLAYCFDETFEGDPDQNKVSFHIVGLWVANCITI